MFEFLRRIFKRKSNIVSRSAVESRLIGACFGDRVKAARLVQYEVSRAPNISRDAACRCAIERLERDRR